MLRLSKQKAHLAMASLLSACVRSNAKRTRVEASLPTGSEQLSIDSGNNDSEQIPLDTTEDKLFDEDCSPDCSPDCSSSSDEDCSSSSDEDCSSSSDEDCTEEPGTVDSDDTMADIIRWKEGVGQSLKRPYGSGSESTAKRRRRHQRELAQEASGCLNIVALFKRQQDLGLGIPVANEPPRTISQEMQRDTRESNRKAMEDIERLIRLKTEQIQKYGRVFSPGTDFYRRHCMVKNFLCLQKQHEDGSGKTRREIAETVAATFDRRQHTAKKLDKWAKEWVLKRVIPESKAGKHKAHLSWLNDEGILCAIQDFTRSQGECKCCVIWRFLNYHIIIGKCKLMIPVALNSYKLCQFLSDYIYKNRPDIRHSCGSTQDVQGVIDLTCEHPGRRCGAAKIKSRTARNWLKKLGYSWKDIKKGIFFDGHERGDVVQYRGQFLEDIRKMLPYTVEFNADGTMKIKEYPSDCAVGGPNRRPIIIITHDESIFSANDGRHQAWISENGMFLRPKGKGKGIMVSEFLLPWSRLNLLPFPNEQQGELIATGVPLEVVEYFKYGQACF